MVRAAFSDSIQSKTPSISVSFSISLLKVSILPQDIAEGVYFFASSKSKKSTGNILNVDGGNITSFTR